MCLQTLVEIKTRVSKMQIRKLVFDVQSFDTIKVSARFTSLQHFEYLCTEYCLIRTTNKYNQYVHSWESKSLHESEPKIKKKSWYNHIFQVAVNDKTL